MNRASPDISEFKVEQPTDELRGLEYVNENDHLGDPTLPEPGHESLQRTPLTKSPNVVPKDKTMKALEEIMSGLKYKDYMKIETHANGGAKILHAYQDDINHLNPQEVEEFSYEFFKVIL